MEFSLWLWIGKERWERKGWWKLQGIEVQVFNILGVSLILFQASRVKHFALSSVVFWMAIHRDNVLSSSCDVYSLQWCRILSLSVNDNFSLILFTCFVSLSSPPFFQTSVYRIPNASLKISYHFYESVTTRFLDAILRNWHLHWPFYLPIRHPRLEFLLYKKNQ